MTSERAVEPGEPEGRREDGTPLEPELRKAFADLVGHRLGLYVLASEEVGVSTDAAMDIIEDRDPYLARAIAALAAIAATPAPREDGTETHCQLEGVHEHAFRGPHRFREWEPGT